MKKVICDFCGKEFQPYSRDLKGKFNLMIGNGAYVFEIHKIEVTALFTTTGMDWCKECLLNGIKSAKFEYS